MVAEVQLNPSRVVEDKVVTTVCSYCGVGCNLELHLKDDFIFKVTSPFASPVNHGNLCVKGRFGYDYIYHPKRVTTPLVRRYLLEGKSKPEGREQVFAVSKDGKPIEHSNISNDWDEIAELLDWVERFAVDEAPRVIYAECDLHSGALICRPSSSCHMVRQRTSRASHSVR